MRARIDGDIAVLERPAEDHAQRHQGISAVRGRRERIASPEEAQRLLAALPERDRPIWATALYPGLRRGELMALRWEDVDLAAGVIRVERSYDDKGHVEIEPKSRAGRRAVPVVRAPRHPRRAQDPPGPPSRPRLRYERGEAVPTIERLASSRVAWKRAELEPIGLHEARHTFASVLIAAGVNAKAITTYMGHASIQTTYDLYGKLMPGSESEAAALVDAYLARANTQARLDQLEA